MRFEGVLAFRIASNSSNKLDIAKSYIQIGWKVFPVHSIDENGKCTCGADPCRDIGKHSITINGVKDATNDQEKLKKYSDGAYDVANIGLATGEHSGVWVLDIDGEEGLKTVREWEGVYGSLPKTVTARTGAGVDHKHLYFLFDERCVNKKNAMNIAKGIDVRFTGGYVILPPSKHKSGGQYKWLLSPNDTTPAPAPDWLLNLIPDRDERAVGGTSKSIDPISKPEPANLETVQSALTLQERCVAYLEKTPPAIEGENGSGTTYNVCCRICELFGNLSDDDLFIAISDWNQRCVPPWIEKGLRRKINEARK